MIDRTNDGLDQAERLVPIALRLHAHVNIIPLNPTPGWPTRPSPPERIRAFADVLEDAGIAVTIRDTRGREIEAACGQLHAEHEASLAG
jgi:23S rRNA (adenine2503-C2)-methyltransferase